MKHLTKLRAELPTLRRGTLVQIYDEEQQTVFARRLGDQITYVAINNDVKPATIKFKLSDAGIDPNARHLTREDYLGYPNPLSQHEQGDDVELELAPRSAHLITVTLLKN